MAESSFHSFIIDASYILGWLLPDETTLDVSAVMQQYANGSIQLFSTVLLPFEIANGLRTATMRRRITRLKANQLLTAFLQLGIPIEKVDVSQVWGLSQKYALTCYDAAYLTLAHEKKMPLLTCDTALAKIV